MQKYYSDYQNLKEKKPAQNFILNDAPDKDDDGKIDSARVLLESGRKAREGEEDEIDKPTKLIEKISKTSFVEAFSDIK